MKKLASIVAVAALALGGVALASAPANAKPHPVLSSSPSVVDSGGALTINLSDVLPVPENSCGVFEVDNVISDVLNAGESIPFSSIAVNGVITIPDGQPFFGINTNGGALPSVRAIAVYPIAGGQCSGLNPASFPTPTASTEWTVNPALTVAPPVPFTTGVADSQTLPTSVSNPTAGPLDATLASSWSLYVGSVCPVPLVTVNPPAIDVALPAGLSIDGTLSAPGVVPALTISGTPAEGTVGDYLVCFTRTDSNSNVIGALVTITVADPAPVQLAKTGVDGMQDGILAGGAALLALLGAAAYVLVRRRTASV